MITIFTSITNTILSVYEILALLLSVLSVLLVKYWGLRKLWKIIHEDNTQKKGAPALDKDHFAQGQQTWARQDNAAPAPPDNPPQNA